MGGSRDLMLASNPMAKILVVGGAGYVGGAACAYLVDQGHQIWVLDDLSRGHRHQIVGHGFTRGRAGDRPLVRDLLRRFRPDGVMHFAALAQVAESVQFPELYFQNNVEETQALVEVMLEEGIRHFIFSSTCAVFGDPQGKPISEDLPKNPVNPYGATKARVEELMQEWAGLGLKGTALRYFNASGAEFKLRTGEAHDPETHLIPRVIESIRTGQVLDVFGTDYGTRDGTCIRDYIHVTDLARAHEAALLRLIAKSGDQGCYEHFNLGSEQGYSVLEVIAEIEKALGTQAKKNLRERRAGDASQLVADSKKARETLNFRPQMGLQQIVESAIAYDQKKRSQKAAVFLDRDGTLNEDPGYLSQASALKLFHGVAQTLKHFKDQGYLLVVVSNQSGVGRGKLTLTDLDRIHDRLDEMLYQEAGIRIDRYELCIHHPDENCACRKPKTLLIDQAARALEIDLKKSIMIGDKITDVQVGLNAGVGRVVLVETGEGKSHLSEAKKLGAEVWASLASGAT